MLSDKLKKELEFSEFSVKPLYEGKTLNIEIASGCNEKCIYCQYSAQGLHKNVKFIDEEFFYRITKEAKELGISDVGLYMTGEPMLNPKIYQYVSYLKNQLHFEYVYISTNGILCTPENVKKLVESGIDSIKFSVSAGTKESFIFHHGVDQFEKVLNNIKFAFEYRQKNNLNYKLFLFCILTKYNISEKSNIQSIFEKYVDEVLFVNVISNPYVKGVKEFLCLDNEESQLMNDVDNIKLPCLELFDRIVINEDGYLCACCHETRSKYTQMEDLNYKSLRDAVYSEKMIELRKRHIDRNVKGLLCENCVLGKCVCQKPLNLEYESQLSKLENCDISREIKRRLGIE